MVHTTESAGADTSETADRRQLQSYIVEQGGSELMAPREIMYLKQLPVLGTGKLDYPSVQKEVDAKFAA